MKVPGDVDFKLEQKTSCGSHIERDFENSISVIEVQGRALGWPRVHLKSEESALQA